MLIKMTKTTRGSRDGRKVEEFVAGESYQLPDTPGGLADVFVNQMKVAVVYKPEPGEKSEKVAPKNKAIEVAPSNKKVAEEPKKRILSEEMFKDEEEGKSEDKPKRRKERKY